MKMKFNECWIPDEWKNKISIIDDILPITHFNNIQSYVTSNNFAWGYDDNISLGQDNSPDTVDNYNFGYSSVITKNVMKDKQGNQVLIDGPSNYTHLLSKDFISFVTPLLWYIKDYAKLEFLIKSRFDMTTRTPKDGYLHSFHVDYDKAFPHVSCIIYMNDSDGDTIFFNETSNDFSTKTLDHVKMDDLTIRKKVQPKKGRVVLFDGSIIHSGCSPYNNKNRILLNCQFTNIPSRNEVY